MSTEYSYPCFVCGSKITKFSAKYRQNLCSDCLEKCKGFSEYQQTLSKSLERSRVRNVVAWLNNFDESEDE